MAGCPTNGAECFKTCSTSHMMSAGYEHQKIDEAGIDDQRCDPSNELFQDGLIRGKVWTPNLCGQVLAMLHLGVRDRPR